MLKLVWRDDGKHSMRSKTVSISEACSIGLIPVNSPSDLYGSGSCFGTALSDFAKRLDEYISCLSRFRDEVVNTKRAYTEAVEVDYAGNPI